MSQELEAIRLEMAEVEHELAALNSKIDGLRNSIRNQAEPAMLPFWSSEISRLEPRRGPLETRLHELTQRALRLKDEAERQLALDAEAKYRGEAAARTWWFRRFHTSLAIANAGAFAAVATHLFDARVPALQAILASWAMVAFSCGLVVSGAIPVALYFDKVKMAWVMAIISAGFLAGGLGVVDVGAVAFARAPHSHPWPGDASLAPQTPASPLSPLKAPDHPPASGGPR